MCKNILNKLLSAKRIGIFGYGVSTAASLSYLQANGASPKITLRADKAQKHVPEGCERYLTGEAAYLDIDEDALILSPSVRRDHPSLIAASARGVTITSEAELFFDINDAPVYAVTGSDGKSTTSYLIAKILTEGGIVAEPLGNFGTSLISSIGKGITPVAELSSFQLMYMTPKSRRALITNVTPNHLNWHKDYHEYKSAKANIAALTEGLVFDYDSKDAKEIAAIASRPFCAVSGILGYKTLRNLCDAENYITRRETKILLNGEFYFDAALAKRLEDFNIKNYMLAAAMTLGEVKADAVLSAILEFRGLHHRAELILDRDGVKYLDSSIDSTPERTLSTLRALFGDVAVIIGGMGKGLSYDALAAELKSLTRGAVLMGEVGEMLAERLRVIDPEYEYSFASDFDEAVKKAKELIGGKGTVILSPAATSFDKYENYKMRALDFSRAVMESNHI